MRRSNNTEQGNVFFIIFIAVALFAALIFSFTESGTSSKNNLSPSQAKIAASDVLEYVREVDMALNRLSVNGCSIDDISFENNKVTGYEFSTSDECKVFHPSGGNARFRTFEEYLVNVTDDRKGAFSWGNNISGSADDDLVFHIIDISKELCVELNETVGGPVHPTDDVYRETGSQRNLMYKGSFGSSAWTYTLSGYSGILPKSFCIIQTCYAANPCPSEDMYSFTYQLLER